MHSDQGCGFGKLYEVTADDSSCWRVHRVVGRTSKAVLRVWVPMSQLCKYGLGKRTSLLKAKIEPAVMFFECAGCRTFKFRNPHISIKCWPVPSGQEIISLGSAAEIRAHRSCSSLFSTHIFWADNFLLSLTISQTGS